MRLESLEDRRLLTVQVLAGGPDLQINATAGTQNMSIDLDAADRYTMILSSGGPFDIVSDPGGLITLDSANQISFDASDFETLFMDFGGGNDTLRFESDNNGYPNSMDISGGTGSDTVINNVAGGAVFDHELRLNVFETITLNEDLDVTRGSTPIDDDRSTAFFIDQNPSSTDPITLNLAENVDIRTHDGDFNPTSAVTMVLQGAGGTNIISADGEVNNTTGTFDPTVFLPTTTASGDAGLDVRSDGSIFLPSGGINIDGTFAAAYDTDSDQTLSVSVTNPIDAPQVTLEGSGADDSLILGSAVSSDNVTLDDWQSVAVGSPFDVSLGGTTPGSEYTQISVEGEVDISGTTLNVSLDFATIIGDTFVIIDNDDTDAVVGTFAGLAEGDTVTVDTAEFTISYVGGSDNNDVVLTTTMPRITTTVDIVAGRLVIDDVVVGGKEDTLTIARDGDDLVVSDPNNQLQAGVGTQVDANTVRIPVALVTAAEIDVNAGDGNDSLTVDLSMTAIGMPINFDGGADDDEITLSGTATDVTHTFTGATSGRIEADTTTINYTGLEPIFDNLSAVNRVFTFTGGAETITLSNEVAMPGISNIDSTLGESVNFTNPTTSLTINAGTGADIVNVNGIDPAFVATLNINGDGDANDRINYNSPLLATPAGLALSAETINLLAGLINTAGPQDYTGAVTLLDNTAITAGTGAVDFSGTINGAFDLAVTTSGTTTFGAVVGGATPLASLTVNTAGPFVLTQDITVSGDIDLTVVEGAAASADDDLRIENSATIRTTTGNIIANIGDDLTVGAGSTLRADTAGRSITINGDAGSNDAFGATLTVNGPVFATNVSLNGNAQADTIDLLVTLAASTTTVNSNAGDDTITIGSAANAVDTLAGPIDVNAGAGEDSLTVDLTGLASGIVIDYDGGADDDEITLSGTATDVTHTFTGATSGRIEADTTTINYTGLEPIFDNLSAVNRVFTFTGGAETITLSNEVAMPGISNIDSTLGESVSFPNPTTSLTINAGTGADIVNINGIDPAFAATLSINGDGANDRINYNSPLLATPTSLALSAEAINLLPSLINTTGPQSYTGVVTLLDNTAITAGTGTVDFNGTVSGGAAFSLSVSASGTTTFAGGVTGLTSLLTNGGGTTAINGGSVATSGDQTYTDAVTIGADTIFTGNNITFNSTLDDDGVGATDSNVTITATTTTTFNGTVGAGDTLTSLTINVPGVTAINGGSVTTTADQTYNGPVILGNDTQLNAANVSINGALDDDTVLVTPSNLTINAAVNTIITGSVGGSDPITSLDVSAPGFTLLSAANIITTGDQVYREAVIVSFNTTLTGNNITFDDTVDDDGVGLTPSQLTITAAAATLFSDTVGGTDPLDQLTVSGPGTTAINGGSVTTGGNQTYDDAVTLGADTLFDGTNIAFNNTLDDDGAGGTDSNVTVAATSTSSFGGAVGLAAALSSLDVTAPGFTSINGGIITTSGDQTYRESVVLGNNTVLSGSNIRFNDILDDDSVGVTPSNLTINATVATRLGDSVGDAVGGADPLDSLTVNGPGATALDGGSVATSGNQTYNEPVTLGLDTTLTAGGDVDFNSTVDGARVLIVASTGVTLFGGVVGGVTPLSSLTVTTAGPFVLGNDMTISGDIDLTVVEGAVTSVDDDLRIENSATVRTTTGSVLANVGDDVTVEALSTLRADTAGQTITINGDAGSNDTVGTTITVGGPVFATNVSLNGNTQDDTIDLRVTLALSTTTIDGAADDDTILIGSAANTLDTFAGPIVVTGNTNASAAPGDVLDLNDADDNDVDNEYELTSTTFTRNSMALLSYDSIETLNLRAGMKDDLIVVMLPDVSTEEDAGTETPLPGVVRVFGNGGHDTVKYMGSDDADLLEIEDVSAVPTVQHQIQGVDCLLILAGDGNDVVRNNTAVTSVMDLGAGSDIANGGSGTDVIYGGAGTEIDINAGPGDDFVLPDHDINGVESISQGDGNPVFIAGGDTINGGAGNDVGFFLTNGVPDKIAGFESGFFDGALIDDVIMWLTAQFLPAAQQGTILSAADAAKCANWQSRYVGTNLATISSPGQTLSALDPSAGDVWYDFVADSDGVFSASGLFDPAGGDVLLTLFDQDFTPLASDYSSDGSALLTQPVTTGQEMYLRVRGANDDVDVTLSVGMPAAPPSVMSVTVGQANSVLSYAMPSVTGAQLDNLPWSIDQLSIQFDQSVDISAGDLTVTGQNGQSVGLMPAAAGFSYDPATHTATWTLDAPVDDDQLTLTLSDSVQGMYGNSLDGEWTNPTYPGDPTTSTFPSGNGTSGGSFEFGVSILSGDVNQDGAVTIGDVIQARDSMSVAPVNVMADMNGDGAVGRGDLVQVIRRLFANIGKPSGAAPAPQAPAALVTAAAAVARSDNAVAATVDAAFSTDDQAFASRRSAQSTRRSIVATLAQRRTVAQPSSVSEVRSLRASRTSVLRTHRDSVPRIVDALFDGGGF